MGDHNIFPPLFVEPSPKYNSVYAHGLNYGYGVGRAVYNPYKDIIYMIYIILMTIVMNKLRYTSVYGSPDRLTEAVK